MAASTLGNLLAATIAGASPSDVTPAAAAIEPEQHEQAAQESRTRMDYKQGMGRPPLEGLMFLLDIMNAVEEERKKSKPKKKGD